MMETISRLFIIFIMNAIWQITLIVIVSFFCDWLLRKISVRFCHSLWVAALFLSFGLPLVTCLDFYRSNYPTEQAAQSVAIQLLLKNSSTTLEPAILPKTGSNVISINENLSIILLPLYLMIFGYRSIRLLRAWRQTRKIRRNIFSIAHPQITSAIIEKCQSVLGTKKARILYSPTITSPLTLGAFRPIIVLPEKFLQLTDRNILLSAIGHELTHVRRNDFLLNLIYEFIYLPVSFHPAATLVKRQIKATRELSCDETVIDKLLEPKVYARSLVRLTDSAMDSSRNTTITIGILDVGILEKRIMKILNKSKITANRKILVLSAASFVFVLSVIVTMSFTLIPVVAQQTSTQENQAKKKAEDEAKQKDEQTSANKMPDDKQQQWDTKLAAKRKAESEISNLSQIELANQTKITMAEAIEIATRSQSGVVLEAKLVFAKNGDANEAFYAIRIVFDHGTEKSEKLMLINGTDGKIRESNH